ncbi:hypothetical protein E2H86_05140 [Pseudomonas putida]|nr:hypothetical protein E2H86_05140 [Pseudomonas putida]
MRPRCRRFGHWWSGFASSSRLDGLFAGQARSHRYPMVFKDCGVPVGAGLSREEASRSIIKGMTHALFFACGQSAFPAFM